jgi:ubiquinone/menaquinone biosynthesis C-methylase UbiE
MSTLIQEKNTNLQFDEEATRQVEAIYTTPDVVAQRRQILQRLNLQPAERVLDIGSGPGFLAQDMAAIVGFSGQLCGIDLSRSMLAMARRRCADQPWAEFREGEAPRLQFPDGSFDVAVSTQVYEYVSDMATALRELYRILRPGGRALILDTDWASIVWHSTNQERMERILAAWDEHLADPYLPRTLAPALKRAGFQLQHREIIPLFNPEYDPNTYSYRVIGLMANFVTGRQGLTRTDVQGWVNDLHELGRRDEYFFSLNRYLFLAVKPAA